MLLLGYAALLLCWTCCTAQRAKSCGYPVIENGRLRYDIRSHFPKRLGQIVDYYCFQDYLPLNGNPWGQSSCSLRGWSPAPKCLKKCYTRQLINGYFPRGGTDFYKQGERTTYTCNPGYHAEHQVVTCTMNGWFPHPRCIPDIKCRQIYVENGYFTTSRTEFRLKEVAPYRCNTGFVTADGQEKGETQCQVNGWTPPPKCINVCYASQLINGYFPRGRMGLYKQGERTTYTCNADYHAVHNVVTCTMNGWFPHPRCIPDIKCQPIYVQNGYFTTSRTEFRLKEVAPYRCNTGFVTADGQEKGETQCQENGWTPPPKCINVCYTSQLINGYFPRDGTDFYKQGERTTYTCNPDYHAEHQVVTCTMNGWFPHPRCIPDIKCRQIYVQNGHFTTSRTEFHLREVAPYRCNTGFVTAGGQEKGETQCQENGWTPPPKCIKLCKAPEDILIHHTNKNVFMPEDRIEYSCLEGYKTANNMPTDTTRCGINGEWSPAPKCLVIECAMLTLPNGDFYPKKGKYPNGDVVKFTCANKFVRVGPASVQCYSFGWFPSPPVCKEKARGCGPPPEITNGNIAGGSEEQYQHGDRKHYECNMEFKLVGSKEIECVDGEWSPPPSCIVACTASEEDMDRNNIELKGSRETKLTSTSGDYIEFRCKAGYVKEQEPSHFRVQCVEGVLDYPRCRLGRSCTVNTEHMESNNIQLQSRQSRTSTYRSGDFIFFECKWWHKPLSRAEKFRAECLDGVITYPTCQPRF